MDFVVHANRIDAKNVSLFAQYYVSDLPETLSVMIAMS
jgi:hypothetical protein